MGGPREHKPTGGWAQGSQAGATKCTIASGAQVGYSGIVLVSNTERCTPTTVGSPKKGRDPEHPGTPGPVKRVQLGTSEAGPGISGPLVLDAMRGSVRNNFG